MTIGVESYFKMLIYFDILFKYYMDYENYNPRCQWSLAPSLNVGARPSSSEVFCPVKSTNQLSLK